MSSGPDAESVPMEKSESPLRQPLFRGLWIATIVSNTGTWMQEVANSWLMTTLAPDPLMVSLVQASNALPVFLLGLPAGALADVIDRRKWLLSTQAWMMLSAAVMAFLTLNGMMTPGLLLLTGFLLAVGAALNSPGWHSVTPEIVPKESLSAAVTLNGLAINCAKAVGPGIGGLVVVQLGPGAAFLLNAVSFLTVVFVLYRWKREPREEHLPTEKFFGAMRVGVQHVTHSPLMRLIVLRAVILVFNTSALWALLPLLCKEEYLYEARGYGLMLVFYGLGAITGGTMVLPRLRRRLSANQITSGAWLAYIPTVVVLSLATHPVVPVVAIFWGGICAICILSSFHLAAQSVAPDWIRARAMSVYLLGFSGAAAFGSLFWGALARGLGVRHTLLLSAFLLFVGMVTAWLAPLKTGESFDHEPANYWPDPELKIDVPLKHGPIMVVVEYDIATEDIPKFVEAMEKIRRIRLRNGVLRWGLYISLENPNHLREVYLDQNWAAHLRQHERVSKYEMEVSQLAYQYHRGETSPEVFHHAYCDRRFPGAVGEVEEFVEPGIETHMPIWFVD